MFPLIGDMGREGGDPIQHREHLKVSLEDRVHLGAVDYSLALLLIAHLLLRERGTEDILGEFLPARQVLAVNSYRR
jgi:hypothetical protein